MLTRALLLLSCAAVIGGCGGGARHAGPRHVLRLTAADRAHVSVRALDRSVAIIRDRLRLLGVRGAHVRRDGNVLVVSLPRAPSARLTAVVTERGDLAMYDLEPALAQPSVGAHGNVVAFASRRRLLRGRKIPPNEIVVTCGKKGDRFCPGVNEEPPTRTYYYLFKHTSSKAGGGPFPQITGADLKIDAIRSDLDENGYPEVLVSFTDRGSTEFQKITKDEYQRGRLNQSPQHFAIVLDDDIKSFPQIDYTDPALSEGISGGGRITGIGTLREANELALVLQTGALPAKFVRVR